GASRGGYTRRDATNAATTSTVSWLDRSYALTRVNWEVVFFVGLMAIAILTRLIDLGSRAFHHDESIHAYFSNYYLNTGNYTTTAGYGGGYDPTYHGPFLYTAVAFAYFLFGSNDAIARLMPAIFGIILVGLLWLLRPFIGRTGAIIASVLVILSPSISYYSRSLRHDIFALTGILLLFVSILWFMRTHQAKWVYLGGAGLMVAYASHELTFIIALVFVVFLALAAFMYNTFSGGARGPNEVNPVRSALSSLATQRWTLIGAVILVGAIYVVLYTNMLTKPELVFSGIWEGLNYWLVQHDVARGNQPIFYYLMTMPIYEPLALLAGLGTVVYMIVKFVKGEGDTTTIDDGADAFKGAEAPIEDEYGHTLPSIASLRGLTWSFLAFWSFAAFIAFSIAGEKMPWLTMHIALPFSLLAAAGLGKLLAGMEWSQVRKGGGLFLGVGFILFLFSSWMLIAFLNGTMPSPTGTGADFQKILRGILLFGFTIGLLALCGWLAYKMMPGRAVKMIGFTIAIVLGLYTFRSMTQLNYNHADVPNELMVYTQSSPDTVIVADLIKRLSRDETAFDADRSAADVTGGHGLTIALDQNEATEWPFDWYFREMKKVTYHNVTDWKNNTASVPPNEAVIIASEATETEPNFKAFIADKYSTNKYVHNWWFPEETYRDTNSQGDFGKALGLMFGNDFKYLLYRDPGKPLGSRNFYLHVRLDLAPKVGLASAGTVVVPLNPAEVTTGTIHSMLDLAPKSTDRGAFDMPRGIATGPDGSFVVVDTNNNRLEKFDAQGKFMTLIGSGKGEGDGQFKPLSDTASGTGAGGVAIDKDGNIYVADTWNHRVQKFDKNGGFVAQWGGFVNLGDQAGQDDPDKNTKFYGPRGIAVGPDNNVYVSDTGNKRISIFKSDGTYVREISSGMTPDKIAGQYPFNGDGEMVEPIGAAVDTQGNVYVADTNNKRIQKFDATGKFAAKWAIPAGAWDAGATMEPFVATDAQGNVYVTGPTAAKVYKFSATGQTIGEKATNGKNVTLKTPTGVTVGQDGNVYVSDTGANGVVNMGTIP
ncbi:MAG: flippase activity-associated protein Agl23, partial [Chloroflexia bacterium]